MSDEMSPGAHSEGGQQERPEAPPSSGRRPRRLTRGNRRAKNANKPPPPDTGLPPGLAAAIALVVAGLAAVGVTGDALTRAVRNQPDHLAYAVILALAASVLLAVTTVLVMPSWARTLLVTVGLLALLGGVAWAVRLGAMSIADREQPLITLSTTSERTGNRTLTVQVSASGLRTTDEILVQVIGLKKFTQANYAVVNVCERSWTYTSVAPNVYEVLPAKIGAVLLWNRIGPDPTGKVNATIKIPIPTNLYQGICAWAPLPDRPGPPGSRRNSAAYLKMTAIESARNRSSHRKDPGTQS
jgi:hypothetical protein